MPSSSEELKIPGAWPLTPKTSETSLATTCAINDTSNLRIELATNQSEPLPVDACSKPIFDCSDLEECESDCSIGNLATLDDDLATLDQAYAESLIPSFILMDEEPHPDDVTLTPTDLELLAAHADCRCECAVVASIRQSAAQKGCKKIDGFKTCYACMRVTMQEPIGGWKGTPQRIAQLKKLNALIVQTLSNNLAQQYSNQ